MQQRAGLEPDAEEPHRLLRRGSRPAFAADVSGPFLNDADAPTWDQVAAVRYRSRRDMLQMTVDLAGMQVDVHTWASLERTQVFPVSAGDQARSTSRHSDSSPEPVGGGNDQ